MIFWALPATAAELYPPRVRVVVTEAQAARISADLLQAGAEVDVAASWKTGDRKDVRALARGGLGIVVTTARTEGRLPLLQAGTRAGARLVVHAEGRLGRDEFVAMARAGPGRIELHVVNAIGPFVDELKAHRQGAVVWEAAMVPDVTQLGVFSTFREPVLSVDEAQAASAALALAPFDDRIILRVRCDGGAISAPTWQLLAVKDRKLEVQLVVPGTLEPEAARKIREQVRVRVEIDATAGSATEALQVARVLRRLVDPPTERRSSDRTIDAPLLRPVP